MAKPTKNVRVTRTTDRRTPHGIRRLGQALIALAQAQLEAEAQAQAEAGSLSAGSSRTPLKPTNKNSAPAGDDE